MVRLLPHLPKMQPNSVKSFNPTMVRLLPSSRTSFRFPSIQFQSHNGAIAAGVVNDCACQPNWFQSHNGAIAAAELVKPEHFVYKFQSHNGAIAAQNGYRRHYQQDQVSIPQWCDCCQNATTLLNQFAEFQSHNGAIAALWASMCFFILATVSIPQWCDCC